MVIDDEIVNATRNIYKGVERRFVHIGVEFHDCLIVGLPDGEGGRGFVSVMEQNEFHPII